MSPKTKVFYPHHLDLWNPIHTIHREVAKELSHKYEFIGFSDKNDKIVNNIQLLNIARDKNKVHKLLLYLVAYSRTYDLVHTGPSPRHKLAKLTSLRGSKLVHTLHTVKSDIDFCERQQILSSQADLVTAVSPYVANWAKSSLGINDVTVIPNGVDMNHFVPSRASTEHRSLLFVGRSIPRKNPDLPIQLAHDLPEYTIRIRGATASDIDDSIPDNVEFVDHLSYDSLGDLYAKSECLLCPFEREGFGMVVVEAMATGTPVIGLNHGNLPNLITEENGILCDSLSPQTWKKAIKNVNKNHEGFSPRKSVQMYDWPNIAMMYDKAYNSVLSSNE